MLWLRMKRRSRRSRIVEEMKRSHEQLQERLSEENHENSRIREEMEKLQQVILFIHSLPHFFFNSLSPTSSLIFIH